MENIPFFSIIMPVYKVEKSLYKAVTSVLLQTFSDFELILVDDCSPDNSGKMCDELAAKDSRIKVIHKSKNEGLGFARNTGITHSTGEYIIFMDSDDWIEDYTLEKSASYIKEDPCDIYAFGLIQDFIDSEGNLLKSDVVGLKPCVADNPQSIARTVVDMDLQRNFSYAWSKIYSSEFLKQNNFLFTDIKLIEDFVFNIAAFPKATRIRVLEDVFYHYIKPPFTTLVSTYYSDFYSLCKLRFNKEYELLKDSGVEEEFYYQAVRDIYIKHILSVFVRDLSPDAKLSFKVRYNHAKEILSDPETISVLKESHSSSKMIKVLEMVFRCRFALISLIIAKLYSNIQKSRNNGYSQSKQ